MISGDLVRVGMTVGDCKEQRQRVAQRKADGYEMEGYEYLRYADEHLHTLNARLVKVVTDYVTVRSRMDYYQEYRACLAAAILLACAGN